MIFVYAMIALGGVIPIVLYRFVRGPSVADRVVALEAVVSIVVALLVLNSYFQASALYMDAALVLSIFGFISTVAMAKYLERGDVFA